MLRRFREWILGRRKKRCRKNFNCPLKEAVIKAGGLIR